MSWIKSTLNGRAVHTEDLVLFNTTTGYSSEIDFVGPNCDFTVIGNTGAVNTVGAVVAEVQMSQDGSTWVTSTSTFMATMDTTTKVSVYVANVKGDAPFYRLAIACAGNDSPTTIEFAIITTPWTAT
jgi:hypothetical protein